MKSAGMARYMANRVVGMDVPEETIKRMGGVPKDKAAEISNVSTTVSAISSATRCCGTLRRC